MSHGKFNCKSSFTQEIPEIEKSLGLSPHKISRGVVAVLGSRTLKVVEKHPKRKFDGGQTCANNADMITPDEMEALEECAVGLMEEYTNMEKIEAAVQSKTFSRYRFFFSIF